MFASLVSACTALTTRTTCASFKSFRHGGSCSITSTSTGSTDVVILNSFSSLPRLSFFVGILTGWAELRVRGILGWNKKSLKSLMPSCGKLSSYYKKLTRLVICFAWPWPMGFFSSFLSLPFPLKETCKRRLHVFYKRVFLEPHLGQTWLLKFAWNPGNPAILLQ